ncbi:hypothetical protein Rhopal_004452-T1 [Rhodotorula paludigena]|uniref:OTU domain-containing protein n=1 Tax=Rhodotorula paludigena TaxID=86838 RepID=A0AAV5GG13_9BASI|nr:hypothetical protein Rhopal_004452-T1 [Rhodotorula paludigena]
MLTSEARLSENVAGVQARAKEKDEAADEEHRDTGASNGQLGADRGETVGVKDNVLHRRSEGPDQMPKHQHDKAGEEMRTYTLPPSATLSELQNHIYKREGITVNDQRLLLNEGEAEAEGGDVEMTDGAPDTVTDACAAHVLEEKDKDEGEDGDARDSNFDLPPLPPDHTQHFPRFNDHLPVNSYLPSSAMITLLALNLHIGCTIGNGNCFYKAVAE